MRDNFQTVLYFFQTLNRIGITLLSWDDVGQLRRTLEKLETINTDSNTI